MVPLTQNLNLYNHHISKGVMKRSVIAKCVVAQIALVSLLCHIAPAHAIDLNSLQPRCLLANNDTVNLEQSEVYENGKLKLRIDDWKSPPGVQGSVDIKSNAPAFNHKIATIGTGTQHSFIRQDTSLCPGVEITANCDSKSEIWRCLFSEF